MLVYGELGVNLEANDRIFAILNARISEFSQIKVQGQTWKTKEDLIDVAIKMACISCKFFGRWHWEISWDKIRLKVSFVQNRSQITFQSTNAYHWAAKIKEIKRGR